MFRQEELRGGNLWGAYSVWVEASGPGRQVTYPGLYTHYHQVIPVDLTSPVDFLVPFNLPTNISARASSPCPCRRLESYFAGTDSSSSGVPFFAT